MIASETKGYMLISPDGVVEEVGVKQGMDEGFGLMWADCWAAGWSLVWVPIDQCRTLIYQQVDVNVETAPAVKEEG